MARLSAFAYALACTKRAERYFSSGVREGALFRVDLPDGSFGIGEYAPLLSIHAHSVADALGMIQGMDLERIDEAFLATSACSIEELAEIFSGFPAPLSSVLSMAHFHRAFLGKASESDEHSSLKLSGFVEAIDIADAVMLAHNHVAQGYSCLKIKVGELPVEEEIKKIKTIAAIASKNVALRLDANRRLSFDDASALLSGLKRINIQYIEEPLFDVGRIKELRYRHGVDVAIDESFQEPYDIDGIANIGATHLIIKPSRFRSIYEALRLAKKAISHNITPVFSPCFESEFASAIAALMIKELDLLDHAHGNIIDGLFKHGLCREPFRPFRGRLFFYAVEKMLRSDLLHRSPLLVQESIS